MYVGYEGFRGGAIHNVRVRRELELAIFVYSYKRLLGDIGEGCSIGYFTNYTSYLIRLISNIILKYVNYTIFDMYNLIKSTFCQYILSNLIFYFIH